MLQIYCYQNLDYIKNLEDAKDKITDGSNDGGIDAVYYDNEENKIIIMQNKYSQNTKADIVASEINKIISTLENFEKHKSSLYNKKLREILQEYLDTLPDDQIGNIDIVFSSLSSIDKNKILSKITEDNLSKVDSIKILNVQDIENIIERISQRSNIPKEAKIKIDTPKNFYHMN